MCLFGRLFFGRLCCFARALVEPRLVLRDDVAFRFLLRELRAGGRFVSRFAIEILLGTLRRGVELAFLGVGCDLPRAAARQVDDPELAPTESLCLSLAHRCRAGLGGLPFVVGTIFFGACGLPSPHRITELGRCVVDTTVTMLAEGLEWVLRLPRHQNRGAV